MDDDDGAAVLGKQARCDRNRNVDSIVSVSDVALFGSALPSSAMKREQSWPFGLSPSSIIAIVGAIDKKAWAHTHVY